MLLKRNQVWIIKKFASSSQNFDLDIKIGLETFLLIYKLGRLCKKPHRIALSDKSSKNQPEYGLEWLPFGPIEKCRKGKVHCCYRSTREALQKN